MKTYIQLKEQPLYTFSDLLLIWKDPIKRKDLNEYYSFEKIVILVYQMIEIINELHRINITHNDIKLSSFGVFRDMKIKLISLE